MSRMSEMCVMNAWNLVNDSKCVEKEVGEGKKEKEIKLIFHFNYVCCVWSSLFSGWGDMKYI